MLNMFLHLNNVILQLSHSFISIIKQQKLYTNVDNTTYNDLIRLIRRPSVIAIKVINNYVLYKYIPV